MDNENQAKPCNDCKTYVIKGTNACRKKQIGKARWIITAVAVIIITVAITACGGNETPKKVDEGNADTSSVTTESPKESETEAEKQKETIFKVGETAELNDVRVTMTGYSESMGSDFNKPADGNEFILVEFVIENNTEKELTISSVMSFDAYADDFALDYSITALMEKGSASQLDGSIAAGKKMKGVIGYEVPTDWENIEIHFTDNVWNDNKFKFEITR